MLAGSRSVILVTVLAAAGSIFLAYFLTFILTRPLLALREMAQKVAAGHLDVRAPVWSKDEIGEVAIAVNKMTDHLVTSQDALARTNRRLTAINQIILAADRELEIHDVLYAVLENVLGLVGLKIGWAYLRDPERDYFHLASWYNVPPELADCLLQAPDEPLCACQQDFVDDSLKTWVNLHTCRRLEATGCFNDTPKHITIPIEIQEQKFGVINLLCQEIHDLSDEDVELLSAIGVQISEIVANAWLRLKLAEKEMARQMLLESLVEAQEEERARLARELHDGAGQMLTSMLVRIKTLERKNDSPELQDGLDSMLEVVSETIEQIRELSYRLRPAALEEFGLPVALETLAKDIAREAGLILYCQLEPVGRQLAGGVDVTLYRIAQEALTNVVRHAQATSVTITLRQQAGQLWLRIIDDGQGFLPQTVSIGPDKNHLGLISMQERAAIIGATLNIQSAPGQGTTIQVSVPFEPGVKNGH